VSLPGVFRFQQHMGFAWDSYENRPGKPRPYVTYVCSQINIFISGTESHKAVAGFSGSFVGVFEVCCVVLVHKSLPTGQTSPSLQVRYPQRPL
jgi:hypothetical protein